MQWVAQRARLPAFLHFQAPACLTPPGPAHLLRSLIPKGGGGQGRELVAPGVAPVPLGLHILGSGRQLQLVHRSVCGGGGQAALLHGSAACRPAIGACLCALPNATSGCWRREALCAHHSNLPAWEVARRG